MKATLGPRGKRDWHFTRLRPLYLAVGINHWWICNVWDVGCPYKTTQSPLYSFIFPLSLDRIVSGQDLLFNCDCIDQVCSVNRCKLTARPDPLNCSISTQRHKGLLFAFAFATNSPMKETDCIYLNKFRVKQNTDNLGWTSQLSLNHRYLSITSAYLLGDKIKYKIKQQTKNETNQTNNNNCILQVKLADITWLNGIIIKTTQPLYYSPESTGSNFYSTISLYFWINI